MSSYPLYQGLTLMFLVNSVFCILNRFILCVLCFAVTQCHGSSAWCGVLSGRVGGVGDDAICSPQSGMLEAVLPRV